VEFVQITKGKIMKLATLIVSISLFAIITGCNQQSNQPTQQAQVHDADALKRAMLEKVNAERAKLGDSKK
jgi:ABC-type molybdate transport system substrate-binding protein